MTLFLNAHADRLAPGSFQQPVPVPAHRPSEPDLVTVCFNKDWLPYILGCLFQLTLNTTWQVANQAELDNALGLANNLILIFQKALPGCQTQNPAYAGGDPEYMLRQNPDNPCELQTSVDGVTWCTWADLSKCAGQPMQPGSTTINPGAGGCQTLFGDVIFGSRWLLPFPVSTGDVITVSNAVGSWASALDLYIPRCPDGNIFFNVSGIAELDACIDGSGHTESGDPAPTINHDSLIAFDGTNYYDCGGASTSTPVVITIPSGVSNANLYFFANTPDTVGFGSVHFDVQYCNNAAPSWSHTMNFMSSANGWSVVPTECGEYVPTVGWRSQCGLSGCGSGPFLEIEFTLPTVVGANYVGWTTFYNVTEVPNYVNDFLVNSTIQSPTPVVGNNDYAWSGDLAGGDVLQIHIAAHEACGPGVWTVTQVVFTGTGVNPFV